eukprot:559650-Amphidinium_carterae.1
MEVSAAPDEEVASNFVLVEGPVNKRPKELDTDSHKDEHHRHTIIEMEKDACKASSSGDDPRRCK